MKKLILILLALALCCTLLVAVACTDTPTEEEQQPSDEQPSDEQPGEDDGFSFALADGSSRYVVMRSDLEAGGHPVTVAAVAIRNALNAKLGTEVTIATDWEKNPPSKSVNARP